MGHQSRKNELVDGDLTVLKEPLPNDVQDTMFGAVLAAIKEHMIYSETDARGRITQVNLRCP